MNQTFLDIITARKRLEIASSIEPPYADSIAEQARMYRVDGQMHRLKAALMTSERINIIAEIKRASPSRGVINDTVDVAALAREYEAGGAAAASVLTEPHYFGGSLEDLRHVRSAISLPILRKDFIVDPSQIYEAALAGADAVLLIVAALEPSELRKLRFIAEEDLGMDALVEVHTSEELRTAVLEGASLIGVNNRDLRSLEVSLDVSRELILQKPRGTLMIAESGLTSRRELLELAAAGFDGFLVGEALMRSNDPQQVLRDWSQPVPRRPRIKICGITTLQDAQMAITFGADQLGFNFYDRSPRYIKPDSAAEIIRQLPPAVGKVGIFVNESIGRIAAIAEETGLDAVQLHGDEDPAFVRAAREATGSRVIRAIGVSEHLAESLNGSLDADAILLDAYSHNERGGTGNTFDWDLAHRFRGHVTYLAGGLTPENVAEAIRKVRPDFVDVCSGVESSPGTKDRDKLERFVTAVRESA